MSATETARRCARCHQPAHTLYVGFCCACSAEAFFGGRQARATDPDQDDTTDEFPPPETGDPVGVDATDSYGTDDRRSGLQFHDEPE